MNLKLWLIVLWLLAGTLLARADTYAFTLTDDPVGCAVNACIDVVAGGTLETTAPGTNPLGVEFADQVYAYDFADGAVSVVTGIAGIFNGAAMTFLGPAAGVQPQLGVGPALMADATPVRFIPIEWEAGGSAWALWQAEGPSAPGTQFYLTGVGADGQPGAVVADLRWEAVQVPDAPGWAMALTALGMLAMLAARRCHGRAYAAL